AFALIHGALRYGWSGIAVFIVISLVVSNILENTSILTGFPFGHYHYTDVLGPKLFLVPVLIGPAYFASGYLAWVLANVLIGDVKREASAFTVLAVPFIASFLMVMWDLTLDPRASTIQHQWIWERGGGDGEHLHHRLCGRALSREAVSRFSPQSRHVVEEDIELSSDGLRGRRGSPQRRAAKRRCCSGLGLAGSRARDRPRVGPRPSSHRRAVHRRAA